jgi:hypothetical protein
MSVNLSRRLTSTPRETRSARKGTSGDEEEEAIAKIDGKKSEMQPEPWPERDTVYKHSHMARY